MMKKQVFQSIRTIVINTLATFALSILIMCLAGVIRGYTLWGVGVPFEMLLVNALVHVGIFVLEKIDLKYRAVHYVIIFIYSIGLIIGFGFLFGWFEAFHIWIVCVAGLVVLALSILIDVLKIKRDAAEINEKLAKLRERRKTDGDGEQEDKKEK
jgi:FtsH-binding integral membrane protein